MTMTEPQTYDGIDPPPIYDADRLVARIDALDEDRQTRLGEAWAAQGHGSIAGRLLDAETYRRIEALVSGFEPGATGDDMWARMNAAAEQFYALPAHIKAPCAEALSVYAGMSNPGVVIITSIGRVAEMERIVGEAVAYAKEQAQFDESAGTIPSVTELPPADDTSEQVASDTYPGTKAKADVVLAWVNHVEGDDRLNRAARAYANEQDRATQRKGITAKLVEILGPDGLAKVNETLAAAQPPPLDLGGGPTSAAEETVGAGTDATASASAASVGGTPASDVEAAPAPAVNPGYVIFGDMPYVEIANPVSDTVERRTRIRELLAELAEVL